MIGIDDKIIKAANFQDISTTPSSFEMIGRIAEARRAVRGRWLTTPDRTQPLNVIRATTQLAESSVHDTPKSKAALPGPFRDGQGDDPEREPDQPGATRAGRIVPRRTGSGATSKARTAAAATPTVTNPARPATVAPFAAVVARPTKAAAASKAASAIRGATSLEAGAGRLRVEAPTRADRPSSGPGR